ncbi:MAG TPA: hypothetical protein PLG95_10210 [Methanoculleus sp.]|nr:hypothetical protein [Methanoculleus sp.]
MCQNAIIHHRDESETVCRCQADLRAAMPRGVWFFPPAGEPDLEEDGFEPGVCLCPVDLDRTARENGYRLSRQGPDGVEDVFDDHLYLTLKVGPVNTRPEERGQLPREWTSVSPQYVVDVPN